METLKRIHKIHNNLEMNPNMTSYIIANDVINQQILETHTAHATFNAFMLRRQNTTFTNRLILVKKWSH